jgi:hypothetical protein
LGGGGELIFRELAYIWNELMLIHGGGGLIWGDYMQRFTVYKNKKKPLILLPWLTLREQRDPAFSVDGVTNTSC